MGQSEPWLFCGACAGGWSDMHRSVIVCVGRLAICAFVMRGLRSPGFARILYVTLHAYIVTPGCPGGGVTRMTPLGTRAEGEGTVKLGARPAVGPGAGRCPDGP